MKSEFLLYRDYVDTRYYSKAVHIVNELAHATYWNAGTVFNKPLSILLGKKSNRLIGNNRIEIWTRDFDVDLHIDEGDEVSTPISEKILEGAKHISKSNLAVPCEKERIDHYITHIEDFGASVDTSCSYQLPRTFEGMRHMHVKVDVLQLFSIWSWNQSSCMQFLDAHLECKSDSTRNLCACFHLQ